MFSQLVAENRPTPARKKWKSPIDIHCKRCGSFAVQWREDAAGWRMYDSSWLHPRAKQLIAHICPPKIDNLEGFDE